MPPANAAIHYVPAGYDTKGPKLMGRMAAGEGFLDAYLRHAAVERLYCYASERKAFYKRSIDERLARITKDFPSHPAASYKRLVEGRMLEAEKKFAEAQ